MTTGSTLFLLLRGHCVHSRSFFPAQSRERAGIRAVQIIFPRAMRNADGRSLLSM